ncbi:unnamed protein product [Enterobius vermicularis]|uniref:Biotin_lipoyl_2 domain-containing protein n=1 Tax=Enterobius vermicularis TaxID=51028 RepID=A0A0N4VLJ1_ENTVE|nr:unnamed protein product [Enterobius vermicularis]
MEILKVEEKVQSVSKDLFLYLTINSVLLMLNAEKEVLVMSVGYEVNALFAIRTEIIGEITSFRVSQGQKIKQDGELLNIWLRVSFEVTIKIFESMEHQETCQLKEKIQFL